MGLRTGSGQQVRSLQPLVLCPSALATSFTNVWEFGAWFCLCPYIYSSLWVCLGGVSATECSPQLNAGPPSPCIFSFCLSLQCFHCWSLISQSCWNYVSCRHFFFDTEWEGVLLIYTEMEYHGLMRGFSTVIFLAFSMWLCGISIVGPWVSDCCSGAVHARVEGAFLSWAAIPMH